MHGLRELNRNPYFGLFRFGLFNPVVTSMRALCAATRLDRGSGMLELQRRQLGEVSDEELVRLLAAQRAKRAAKM